MWTGEVPREVARELSRAFVSCGALNEDPEPFLGAVFTQAGSVPPALTRLLLRFRADPSAPGLMLIKGLPIDDRLPPTPASAETAIPKETFVSEGSILLIGLLLGEPVAYADEKRGALVQNVFPVKAERRAPSNESSEIDLGFHTELSFSCARPDRPLHVANPDFLLLFGLRPAPLGDAVTTLVEGSDIAARLSAGARAALRAPLYQLRAPYSFTQTSGAERVWSQPVPLFHGSEGTISMAFDLACGVRALSAEAQDALDEMRGIVSRPEVQQHVRLSAGDLLVVHNRKCAHARSRFQARFDGTDRWLQRLYVRRSLDGLEAADTRSFRVL